MLGNQLLFGKYKLLIAQKRNLQKFLELQKGNTKNLEVQEAVKKEITKLSVEIEKLNTELMRPLLIKNFIRY